jgi:hypothetical protein
MAQAVIRWPVTAEARVRCQTIPYVICDRQSGTGTGVSRNTNPQYPGSSSTLDAM